MKSKATLYGLALSLAAVGSMASLGNASAYTYVGNMSEDDVNSYLQNYGSDIMAMDLAVSCNEINNVITNSRYRTNLFLTENCSNLNINVPSGKRIGIFTNYYTNPSGSSYGSMSSINTASGIIDRNSPRDEAWDEEHDYHIDNSSITIAKGATVTIGGSIWSGSKTPTIITNQGTLFLAADVEGDISNTGTLTMGGGNYVDAKFSGSGTFRATDGVFETKQIAQRYAMDYCKITEDEDGFVVTQPAYMWEYYGHAKIPAAIDVNVPYTITPDQIDYPEIAEANMIMPRSSATSVLKVSGSPTSGITLTGIKGGSGVGILFTNDFYTTDISPRFADFKDFSKYYKEILTYELADKSISKEMAKYINDLFNEAYDYENDLIWPALKDLVDNDGKVIISKLQKRLDESEVSEAAAIKEFASKNGSTVANYYDVDMQLTSSVDSSKIADIYDLKGVKQAFELDIPDDLPAVKEGYERTYQVYRVHDGVIDELGNKVVDNKVAFETDKFSVYALGYKDEKAVKTPDTGLFTADNKGLIAGASAMGISLAGIAVYILNYIAKRQKNKVKFNK